MVLDKHHIIGIKVQHFVDEKKPLHFVVNVKKLFAGNVDNM